jgi:folate-binding protein YgfZ
MQYFALHSSSGIVQLHDWSSITLTGNDRQTFLNNFCTNDLKRLSPDRNCEAFFCNVKGKIVGHGLITRRDTELVIIGPPGQGAILVNHLDRYVIREDVALRNTTAERSYVLLAGDGAARGMAAALAPSAEVAALLQDPTINIAGKLVDIPVRWIRWNLLGEVFCGLIEVQPSDVTSVTQAIADRNIQLVDRVAFDTLRIEAGTPLFGIDFDDCNFPQEVNRDEQAISFTKGCYLGQETVARIDALGHVNQKIVGVVFSANDVPPTGTKLVQSGANVGRVSSAIFSPALDRPLALAMVRRDHDAIGSKFESAVGPCEVIALPIAPAD